MAETAITLPPPPPQSLGHRVLTALGLLALLGSALFGGNVAGVREHFLGSETPEARPAALSRTNDAGGTAVGGSAPATEAPKSSVLRSQPWWQGVGKIEGTGSTTAPAFTVDAGALQWRVNWTCQTGQLTVRVPDQRRPVIVDSACPASGTGYGIQKGSVKLDVTAGGPWQMQVDQQVDVPLVEPPLPAMTASGAAVVETGNLYRIDQNGTGTVNLYRLADGRMAVRLDNFFVTANSDLELQFSNLDAPKSTKQVTDSERSPSIASLDVTTGSLNFVVPPAVNPLQYKSLVIWCEVANSAYAAATLRPA